MFLSYLPPLFKTLHIALRCLEGSTMSNLVHRRRRCARIDLYTRLCLEGSTPEDVRFIYVYRLAIDARPKWVMMRLPENIQACLRDFQTGTASMDRQRHHASIARGFYCFCLTPSIRKLIRSIRPIRGRIQSKGQELSTSQRISLWLQRSLFCTAIGSYFVLWFSVCQQQTRQEGRFRQANLLAWMNITIRLQGRKPGESNKLFDLYLPQ